MHSVNWPEDRGGLCEAVEAVGRGWRLGRKRIYAPGPLEALAMSLGAAHVGPFRARAARPQTWPCTWPTTQSASTLKY